MVTDKLYYEDVYRKEFEGTVLECIERKEGYSIILDRTAFYPEGGGQPWDIGKLILQKGEDEISVLEVHEKEDVIYHYTDRPVLPGVKVRGIIDWSRRFDLMQQHSGEHLVSGLVHERFGYHNVGFHMGNETITIDFDGELSSEELDEIEKAVNKKIWENISAEILWPSPQELETLTYRSKKDLTGEVRIVRFVGADTCACCGLHVAASGEIGMVKLLSVQKFRTGVRIEMISGNRVLRYLDQLHRQNREVSVCLSAKMDKTAEAVKRLSQENYQLRGRVFSLEEKWFCQEAERLQGKGNILIFQENLQADSVRKLADAVMQKCGGICAVFSCNEDSTWKYAAGQLSGDLRELVKEMNRTLKGRGGGKPFFVQGSSEATKEEIRAFFMGLADKGFNFYEAQ